MELRLVLFGLLVGIVMAIYLWPRRSRENAPQRGSEAATSRSGAEGSPDLLSVDLNRRVPVPKRRGKSNAQRAADDGKYSEQLRLKSRAAFAQTRANAAKAGSTRYIWRTCGDADVCLFCAGKDGKKFNWDAKPGQAHPGDCEQCSVGHCRCFAEPILPRL